MSNAPAAGTDQSTRVHRIQIHPTKHAGDPRVSEFIHRAKLLGTEIPAASSARIFLIEADLSDEQLDAITTQLLCNPVVETVTHGTSQPTGTLIEIHPLPGVMDPPAQSTAAAIKALTGIDAQVSTGYRYDIQGLSQDDAKSIAQHVLANPVVSAVHTEPYFPDELPKGHNHAFDLTHVPIRELTDDQLETLSRDGHLFLDLHEMQAIQKEYQTLGREPTDIELETLAQTWSEHCVHKTLKATIHYTGPSIDGVDISSRPHHEVHDDGSVTIHNLLKATVAAATFELIDEGLDWTQSVFVDNAGIIKFDDDHSVCIKVETHNHPSALEPYGGAATGIGGCIRDIMGTGLAAKPIASTDVFCVAHPETTDIPDGCLHPKQILSEIVGGVRDYGNRMGIPTVNGAVSFDQRYIGNPLVYCGCIGIMPSDLISGDAQQDDRIIALGGRTGRDGIHGATFSSAELTDTHADEFSHAVQIGNAIEEKRTLDAILRARDAEGGPLFSAITDCGAGGFSSAVGEMGEKIGADVHLDRAPLKYNGLTYDEIWISEAQERMVLAVPEKHLTRLRQICEQEHVEMADLGHFGTPGAELILNFQGTEVGRLPMEFLHDGIPTPTRTATWEPKPKAPQQTLATGNVNLNNSLLELLAHPDIASKHWIIRQYDHEVQGNTIVKPLVGPRGIGPSDASVIEPVPGTGQGLSVGCGLATSLSDDPYQMTLAAIDECIRNLVCVGTDPDRVAILDNFCWPSCKKPENLGSLVRAAHACYDGAKAYKTPFVSGKDSLNNQFTTKDGTTIEIPPTLLITGMGIVHSLDRIVTSDVKSTNSKLLYIGLKDLGGLIGTTYEQIFGTQHDHTTLLDPKLGAQIARFVASLITDGHIRSAHDVSDGGPLCSVAEMLIAGSTSDQPIGADLTFREDIDPDVFAFNEAPCGYILEIDNDADFQSWMTKLPSGAHHHILGQTNDSGMLTNESHSLSVSVNDLTTAWRSTLDW
ncbi:MAG: AIR synthase-related protein [Phycisphaerales bacterium]